MVPKVETHHRFVEHSESNVRSIGGESPVGVPFVKSRGNARPHATMPPNEYPLVRG